MKQQLNEKKPQKLSEKMESSAGMLPGLNLPKEPRAPAPPSAKEASRTLDNALNGLGKALQESPQSIQLPLWYEAARGTPNSFLRSALFAAIQSKDRKFLKEAVLASSKDITVKFTGEQLNQEDLTVWETLVHLARKQPLGTMCNFTAYGLLKSLHLNTGNDEHKRLHSTIIRLTACAVEVTHEGRTYFGSMIKSGVKDEMTKNYVIELNPQLIRLYGETRWTALHWETRLSLRRKPLAQALHGYYSTHAHPLPVKLATLRDYTGSRNEQAGDFKRKVRAALEELVKRGFISHFRFEKDLVHVRRP